MTDEAKLIEAPLESRLMEVFHAAMMLLPSAPVYWVAFSGGVDSTVLLDLVLCYCASESGSTVKVVHIHHGLSKNADVWEAHCREVCKKKGVDLVVRHLGLADQSEKVNGIESRARTARYDIFEHLVNEDEVLLQGHHLNDQTETFFFRASRGAGVRGLSSIPRMRSLGKGCLLRPILGVSKSRIIAYAESAKLSWIEDESNLSRKFDRNFIRHEIIPELLSRWPTALEKIGQAANYCHESTQLNQDLADIDLAGLETHHSIFSKSLNIGRLQALSLLRQKNVLLHWLSLTGLDYPGEKGFQRIWSEMLTAESDRAPIIHCPYGLLRRSGHSLFAVKACEKEEKSSAVSSLPLIINLSTIIDVKQFKLPLGYLLIRHLSKLDATEKLKLQGSASCILTAALITKQIEIRFRQGGERICLEGETIHRPLKTIFQKLDIPVWERAKTPLLFVDDQLATIADRAISNEMATSHQITGLHFHSENTAGWLFQWLPSHSIKG